MMPSPLFSAWSFANVGMLAWGAAVAIPVIIHLWNRRTRDVMQWAAMEFLMAAIHKHSRRLRLAQWILLAVRATILILLAIALADPIVSGFSLLHLGTDTNVRQHTVLVIDESYSMAAQSGDQQPGNPSVFDLAKSQAIELVRRGNQGDGFTLLTLGASSRSVVGNMVFERDDMVREIKALSVSHDGADLAATVANIDEVIEAAAQGHPAITRCQVVVFTDLARQTWQAANSAELQRAIARLADKAEVVVREIGQPSDGNVVIERLTTPTPLAPLHRIGRFETEIRNYSLREQRRRVEFLVDGVGLAQQPITIPAEGSAVATFSHRFDGPGPHVVEARVDRDALELDNHRSMRITTPQAIRVLCVEGRPHAARFVALALDPTPDGTADFQPLVVTESGLVDLDLTQYDCIVLCNVGRLGNNEVQRLNAFLQGGGGLITILGDLIKPQNYNDQLGGGKQGSRLIPAVVDELVGGGPHPLDALQYQHPLIEPFRGHERAGLLTLPIWRYFRLQPHPNAEIVLAFANGDPALITQNVHRGRSLLLATAADADSIDRTSDPMVPWSALVSWPSFPPLIHEMVNYAVSGHQNQMNFLVGEPWTFLTTEHPPLVVVDPSGESYDVPHSIDDMRIPDSATRLSGVYEVQFAGAARTTELVAVNLDTREGDLDRLNAGELPSQIKVAEIDVEDAPATRTTSTVSPLFRVVLAAVFLLVLLESTLSWWLSASVA